MEENEYINDCLRAERENQNFLFILDKKAEKLIGLYEESIKIMQNNRENQKDDENDEYYRKFHDFMEEKMEKVIEALGDLNKTIEREKQRDSETNCETEMVLIFRQKRARLTEEIEIYKLMELKRKELREIKKLKDIKIEIELSVDFNSVLKHQSKKLNDLYDEIIMIMQEKIKKKNEKPNEEFIAFLNEKIKRGKLAHQDLLETLNKVIKEYPMIKLSEEELLAREKYNKIKELTTIFNSQKN